MVVNLERCGHVPEVFRSYGEEWAHSFQCTVGKLLHDSWKQRRVGTKKMMHSCLSLRSL